MTRAVLWSPHPRQRAFLARGEFEVLYGGAAGGGKSDALIADAVRLGHKGNYRALLLRRTFPELSEILDRTRRLYPRIFPGAEYKASEHTWVLPSGARIRLGHCQHEDSIYQYQGDEFHYVGVDEAGRLTPKQYLYIFSRLRSVDTEIRPLFRATSNPGGPCHAFLKARFKIGNIEPETTIYEEFLNTETGEVMRVSRAFVPATVYDNPTLMKADPGYIQRLLQLPEIEKQRLLYGDWSAFAGQFFHELNPEVHGCEDFDIPPEWEVFRVFDWGYAKPWACLFIAVDFDGNLWVFREIYGSKGDEQNPDAGKRQTATEVSRKIKEVERELKRKIHLGPADPSIWSKRPQKDGTLGISVADEMGAEQVYWIKADNDRKQGWHQVHTRLSVDEQGRPGCLTVRLYAPTDQAESKNSAGRWFLPPRTAEVPQGEITGGEARHQHQRSIQGPVMAIYRGDMMVCPRCSRTNRVVVNRWGDTMWNQGVYRHCLDCHGTGWEPKDKAKVETEEFKARE